MQVVNFGLLKRWENWVTVLLMLLIACFAINSLSRLILQPAE